MIPPTLPARSKTAGSAAPFEREPAPALDASFGEPARVWLQRCECGAIAVLLVLVAALHVRFVTNVGGLWRDETNSVSLATLPSLAEIWRFLDYDSFPVLFFGVLRGWTRLFGADNDIALRTLGLITGLGILAALWANARSFGIKWPVLSFALVGLNPMLIRYGDSTRAYGLGIVLILLTFRSFWRLVDSPSPAPAKRILASTILALLSVQCLYYNSVLLCAIAAGAVAVAFQKRAWRNVGIILGIGMLAAASLLPYVPMMRRMREWTFMVAYPADFSWLWKRAGEVMGSPRPVLIWMWTAIFVAGVALTALALVRFWRRAESASARESQQEMPAAALFGGVTLVVGVVGYASFLNVLNYYTQPWYYITLAAFAACAIEVVFGVWSSARSYPVLSIVVKGGRLVVAALLLAVATGPAWRELRTRHTNVDLVAARLKALTSEGDVIVVPRWECAITLCRYYHGPAAVITLPPIADHRFHRYDLVLRQMMTPDAIQPVLAHLEETLGTGHRVFLVGAIPFPGADVHIPSPTPLYRDSAGDWHGENYSEVWVRQTGHFLRTHAISAKTVPVPENAPVQGYEHLEVAVVEGRL